jgi:hypothetical protein
MSAKLELANGSVVLKKTRKALVYTSQYAR